MVNLNKTRTSLVLFFNTQKSKDIVYLEKEGKALGYQGSLESQHNESDLRLHQIKVNPFWNPARISLDESLSGEKTSLG